jgi:8-amino-7-oxononanoate synthase
LRESLDSWEDRGLLRELRAFEPLGSVRGRANGKEVVLFSTNDYLGLSYHPEVREAVAKAVRDFGMGARGSALVCGYSPLHEELEARLAHLKKTESALLFPTGFAANLAVLQSLADRDTTIFSDELNHASMIDGCRMAKGNGAEVAVYRHRDIDRLGELLRIHNTPKKLIVTDTVFGMDGDLAPLAEIVDLKEDFGAMLCADEAHATLVFGEKGGGLAEHLGVSEKVDVHIGTLSKAFGLQGGFVASNSEIRSWLLNRGRSYIFSTALPVPLVAGALAALDLCTRDSSIQSKLWESIDYLSNQLGASMESPILPIRLNDNVAALDAANRLFEKGFHVPAIRPPSVPEGTARLRIALSAAHSREDLLGLVGALHEMGFPR